MIILCVAACSHDYNLTVLSFFYKESRLGTHYVATVLLIPSSQVVCNTYGMNKKRLTI